MKLTFAELLNVTPSSHADYDALEIATKEITKVAERINVLLSSSLLTSRNLNDGIYILYMSNSQEGDMRSYSCEGSTCSVKHQRGSCQIIWKESRQTSILTWLRFRLAG